MAGGVPREVVVHDGGEAVLQVDALREAVGGDQQPGAVVLGERVDAGFAFFGGQGSGDGLDPQAGVLGRQRGSEVLGEVVGGGDVAAEHDRVVAVGQQVVQQRYQPLELGVGFWALQGGGHRGQFAQASPRLAGGNVGIGGVGPECGVFALEGVVEIGVEDAGFGERVDVVGAVGGGDCGPVEQGLLGRGRAGGQAAQQGDRRPPAHPLVHAAQLRVGDVFAGERHDVVEQLLVSRGEPVGGLGGFPLRERCVLAQVFADVGALALNHELSQQFSIVVVLAAGQVGRKLAQPGVEQPDQPAARRRRRRCAGWRSAAAGGGWGRRRACAAAV